MCTISIWGCQRIASAFWKLVASYFPVSLSPSLTACSVLKQSLSATRFRLCTTGKFMAEGGVEKRKRNWLFPKKIPQWNFIIWFRCLGIHEVQGHILKLTAMDFGLSVAVFVLTFISDYNYGSFFFFCGDT